MPNRKPNILLIMSDEHNPRISSVYGHPFVQTPGMERLAAEGVVIEDFYCNSPLCVPSRMSFLTGRYASEVGAYDLQTTISSAHPTLPHFLNAAGYDTVLAGKMHFVGPDQRHGYRQRLVEEIHGLGSFDGPDWEDQEAYARKARKRITGTGKPDDGSAPRIQHDKEVFQESAAYLREYAAGEGENPFFLTAGFFAPHFPLVCEQEYWDLYWPELADLPENPEPPAHPMYQRFRRWFDLEEPLDSEQVRRCRAAYFGLTTYLDYHLDSLLSVLDETGLAENTIVIYTSDHGEMLGERGLWWKNCFLDDASRVPLIIRWPERLKAGERIKASASLVDLTATILAMAGVDRPGYMVGESLLDLLEGRGSDWKDSAFIEYLAHGTDRPQCSLRKGRSKLNYVVAEPCELYDLEEDPRELTDLADREEYRDVRDSMIEEIEKNWDGRKIWQEVLMSQQLRKYTARGEKGLF